MAYDSSLLDDSSPAQRWKAVVGTFAGLIVGLVFLVAAWGKAIHPEAFVEQIRFEGLDFFGLAHWVALAAIAIEVALGTALVLGLRRWWVMVPTVALVVFFLFLTGRSYWRFEQGIITEAEHCGCFGNLVSRTPAQAFWQDLGLLGVPLIFAFLGRSKGSRRRPVWRMTLVTVLTAASVVLALVAPGLPIDDLATRLKPGVAVSELCAGAEGDPARICLDTLIAELGSGHHWVVMTGLEEASFLESVPRFNEATMDGSERRLWIVSAASEEVVGMFAWTEAPAFEVREAPAALLRPLYRQLPRSFEVLDGRVVTTLSGLPPEGF
jgi:uncharacterized membrane protein YphA (DoxX/SURF4 family)